MFDGLIVDSFGDEPEVIGLILAWVPIKTVRTKTGEDSYKGTPPGLCYALIGGKVLGGLVDIEIPKYEPLPGDEVVFNKGTNEDGDNFPEIVSIEGIL